MDTGKTSLEKDRELVSWTNSIKSNDSSSKLGTTDLSSFQESATSSPIRSSIANEIGPCAFAWRMQDALTSLKLSGVDATFASTQLRESVVIQFKILQEFNISCYRSASCKESHVIPFFPVSSRKISAQFQRWISATTFLSNFAPIWVRSPPNLRD